MAANLAPVDELLQGASADGVVPGVVALVADRDGVVYEGVAGRLRIDDDAPATADTMFRIASMTKALTSVAALQLIEQGRLALDQTVESVIPAFGALQLLEGFDGDEPRLRKLSREPTIQHLLTHTSGLAYWFSNADLYRWHQVTDAPDPFTGLRKCLDTPFVAEPGERWEYGVNTAWLGLVVEAVAGQPLEAYLTEHVFEPLGMTDATFSPSDAQRARLMDIHDRTPDGGLAKSKFEMPQTPEMAFGGEGAYATAGDYMRFLRAVLRGGELDGARILEPETVSLMFTDHLARRPAAGDHGIRDARAHQRRPVAAVQAGMGTRPAPAARGRPGHAPRRLRRLGGAVQLLLLGRPARRGSRRRSSRSCSRSSMHA